MRGHPLLLSVILVALWVSGCRPSPELPESEPAKNLLLITVDSLRPDRLGFAGHDRPTSPALDALAAEGLVFSEAYSQAGWTLPSIASILTGRLPSEHGATEVDRVLHAELPTLATVLDGAGYDTMAFVSHVMLGEAQGLTRGFDLYDASVLDLGHPHKVASAVPLTDRVLEHLPTDEAPYFLWVHYFDPHFDYLAHAEWSEWGRRKVDRYDGEIAWTDREIGRLLEGLTEAGLMDDTVTVVTADHGEAFGELGNWLHYSLRDEVARIPLVIHGPTIPARSSDAAVQQIDLMPTLLELLGVERPAGLRGRDLLDGAGAGPATLVFERVRPAPFVQRGVVRGRHKFVEVEVAPGHPLAARVERVSERTGVHPGLFLYDLENDPGETENLYRSDDPLASELSMLLEAAFDRPQREVETTPLDAETRDRLRSLGYVN